MKHVLFVCIGNSCRSPMAQGFANYYGKGWLEAVSAGTHPAGYISPKAIEVMAEKGIDISKLPSQGIRSISSNRFDWSIVLEPVLARRIEPLLQTSNLQAWDVFDPVGQSLEIFREVRDQIEMRVLDLVDLIQKES
jgi:arsenate reductase (thioredoxin)